MIENLVLQEIQSAIRDLQNQLLTEQTRQGLALNPVFEEAVSARQVKPGLRLATVASSSYSGSLKEFEVAGEAEPDTHGPRWIISTDGERLDLAELGIVPHFDPKGPKWDNSSFTYVNDARTRREVVKWLLSCSRWGYAAPGIAKTLVARHPEDYPTHVTVEGDQLVARFLSQW